MKTAFKTYYQRFRAWVVRRWVEILISLFFLTVADVAITAVDVYLTKRNFDSREAAQTQAAKERAEIITSNKQILKAAREGHDGITESIKNFKKSN